MSLCADGRGKTEEEKSIAALGVVAIEKPMSFVPKYRSPCDLAQKLPGAIAELLQADTDLQKRFREETITDLVVASIKALPIENLLVAVPHEKSTSSDFDILVVSKDRQDAIQFRLQAKRLSTHHSNWQIGSYKELAHPRNSGRQAATLIRSSASEKIQTIPLYAFYNSQGAINQSRNTISGFELASGIAISRLVRAMVNAKPQRLPYKRIGVLQPLFFPLSKLLCEPFMMQSSETGITPAPKLFRQIVVEAITSRIYQSANDSKFAETDLQFAPGALELAQPKLFDLPAVVGAPERPRSDPLPAYIEKILDMANEQRVVRAHVKRPKIILRSD